MNKKPTRAEQMAAQYALKLKEMTPATQEPLILKTSDVETPEQQEKLIKAREKLATFKDFLG